MKKRIVALFAMLAVACLVLVGCGGGAAGGEKAAFVGSWTLTSMTESGEEMTEADLKTLKDLGLEVTIKLDEDGKATLTLFGEAMEGTWETTGAAAAKFKSDTSEADMVIENEQLKMEQDGSSLVFSKSDATAAASSVAEASSAAAEPAQEATATDATDAEAAPETDEADAEAEAEAEAEVSE